MAQFPQPTLFQNERERESKLQAIDRRNQEAARVILQEHPEWKGSGLWEWACKIQGVTCGVESDGSVAPSSFISESEAIPR